MTVDLAHLGRIHLIGVGGAGMSAVAVLLAGAGLAVTGSDAHDSVYLAALRAAGVDVRVGADPAAAEEADTIVVSTAIRESNPVLARARQLGRRVLHRSEALAMVLAGRRTIAVAGSHGKSTTSAMTAHILRRCGFDPSYAIGAIVTADQGEPGVVAGGRCGAGDVAVIEADESDASFLHYEPTVAVVTNVEPDHLDFFGSRAAFEDAFAQFTHRIVPGGVLIAGIDDPGAAALLAGHRADGGTGIGYGFAPGGDGDVAIRQWRPLGAGSTFNLHAPTGRVGVRLGVPGEHNAANATAAWVAAVASGADPVAAANALATFQGTGRRFEHRGSVAGVTVVDDYAHHPTEVAALLRAARRVSGDRQVVVLFQPHLYSRTKAFAGDFAAALSLADQVVVTDIYAAREDPDPAVTAELITGRLPGSSYVADRMAAARTVAGLAQPGDLVLTVGAGDVTELADVILARLRETR